MADYWLLDGAAHQAPWGLWCLADCSLVFDWTAQRGSTEKAEHKHRATDRTSDISTADDSMNTGRRFVKHQLLK